jgi:hypothetical protein
MSTSTIGRGDVVSSQPPAPAPVRAITNQLLDAVAAVVDGSEGLDGLGDDAHVVVRRADFELLIRAALAAVQGGGK